MTHFRNYFWKEGKPQALHPCTPDEPTSYKIISDPYRKRLSVEQYISGRFERVIYDSSLFDFRHLKSEQWDTWQREHLDEKRALLRDINDRIILMEYFQEDTCQIFSPQGILIATQTEQRLSKNDPFNGVTLVDSNAKPVLIKHYDVDEAGNFTTLLKEVWEHRD